MSKNRRAELKKYQLLKGRYLLEHPVCECCERMQFPKKRKSKDIHHTRGRRGELLLDERFWRAVCRPCREWITNNPRMARKYDMICEPGLWNSKPK